MIGQIVPGDSYKTQDQGLKVYSMEFLDYRQHHHKTGNMEDKMYVVKVAKVPYPGILRLIGEESGNKPVEIFACLTKMF